MRSIRLSLIVYFLVLLAVALGTASAFVYETTRSTLTGRKEALRTLLKVAIGDKKEIVTEAVNALMGSKPEARFRFIQEHAAFAKDLDI